MRSERVPQVVPRHVDDAGAMPDPVQRPVDLAVGQPRAVFSAAQVLVSLEDRRHRVVQRDLARLPALTRVDHTLHDRAALPYATRRADLAPESIRYRFVGTVDGTQLDDDPDVGGPATLGAGETDDFETTEPFVVASQRDTHPFAVAHTMVTAALPGGTRPGATAPVPGIEPQLGDEAFVLVLPPGQFLNRYV